jgi:hypothetical protein
MVSTRSTLTSTRRLSGRLGEREGLEIVSAWRTMGEQAFKQRLEQFLATQRIAPALRDRLYTIAHSGDASGNGGGRVGIVTQAYGA